MEPTWEQLSPFSFRTKEGSQVSPVISKEHLSPLTLSHANFRRFMPQRFQIGARAGAEAPAAAMAPMAPMPQAHRGMPIAPGASVGSMGSRGFTIHWASLKLCRCGHFFVFGLCGGGFLLKSSARLFSWDPQKLCQWNL